MKTVIALSMLCTALAGCVAVPVEPGPVVYAAPPPAVVMAPRAYYYYPYPYRPYWRHGWR